PQLGFPNSVSSCRIRSSELRTWPASPPYGTWCQGSGRVGGGKKREDEGEEPGNTPKNWLRSPQAQLLVSRGPCKPSSASLTPEGPASPLIIWLPSQGAPDAWCPRPPLQLSCDSAVSPPPFPYSFLSLAGNRIRQVENLRDLPHLQLLDLSENLIEILKLDEFPESLLILNLTGNSCTNQESYRRLVTEALPLLLDLDGQPVAERWISDEEDKASSNEDEEFPELRGPFCSERGFLKELEQEMSRHREHRQQTALLEHLLRVEVRPALTDLPLLPGAPTAGNSSPSVTPRQGKETSPEPVSLPQASSATKKPCLLASRSQQSTVQAGKGARAAAAAKASPAGAPSTTKTVTKKIKK
uniref:Leucine rich repeat containing 46 n=1 Tax=Monodon monoceros TaxID=40151 RepID=A0A8C6BYW4_MONMO